MKCQPKKSKFKKKEKKRLEISFYTREPKVMIGWCATDRRMDEQMDGKSDMLRSVPHLKIIRTTNLQPNG